MLVDLKAPYQTYTDKLADGPEGGVAFSTGTQPWGYAAAIGLGLGGDVKAHTVEIALITGSEPVYVFMVDNGYHPVGDRHAVPAKTVAQMVSLPITPTAYSIVVQAGDAPNASRVTVLSVVLRLI